MFLSKFFRKEEAKNKKNEAPKKESKATPPNLSFKKFSRMMNNGEKFVLK